MIREVTKRWLKENAKRVSYAEISRETGIRADTLSKFVRGERPNPTTESIETIWRYISQKGFDFHLSDYQEHSDVYKH